MSIINTDSMNSGERIQIISLDMAELIKVALETALCDPNGLIGLRPSTKVSLEIAAAPNQEEGTAYARFELGEHFDIVRDLDGSLRVIDLKPESEVYGSVHLMLANEAT